MCTNICTIIRRNPNMCESIGEQEVLIKEFLNVTLLQKDIL